MKPYVACVPQFVYMNCSYPIGLILAPTESADIYELFFDAVYRQLLQALESEGMNEIKCNIGDNFDHNIHYAMDTVEVDDENMIGKIMKVYVKGYKLHDRLIRPATVSVGAKKEEKEAEKDSAQA